MIGDNIKKLMRMNGYTQKELAMRSGCTETTISKYITGYRTPSIKSLENLAIALGVSIDNLINLEKYINHKLSKTCDFCTNGRTHEDLTDDNDYGSIVINGYRTEDKGYRLMLTYGWGKPLRIETDVWNDKRQEWSLHVLQYYPKFCPECGRRLSEYGAEGDILQNRFPHRRKKK